MRLLRTLLFLVLVTIGYSDVKADHYLGGEISYTNIKNANNQATDFYKWKIVIYVDRTGVSISNIMNLQIYKNSNSQLEISIELTKSNAKTYLNFPETDCPFKQAQNLVEYVVYESAPISHASLTDIGGYYAKYNYCCSSFFTNIDLGSNSSSLNFIDFKGLGTASIARFNSSPFFTKPAMNFLKVGNNYSLDWSAIDVDGDSLVYVLDTPKYGIGPKSSWDIWQFYQGYSLDSNVAGGDPDFKVNPSNGIITYKPKYIGNYLICLKVIEYRKINGIPTIIGETKRQVSIKPRVPVDVYPVLYDSLPNTSVYDTILANSPIKKVLAFGAMDIDNDSLFIKIIPDKSSFSNNILDTNLIKVTWKGMFGKEYMGVDAENFIIRGKSTALAYVSINADSTTISAIPYKFSVVSYKKNCPYLLTDSVHYNLLITGNKCYKTVQNTVSVCDSFVALNGNTYYQSQTLIDTVKSLVGCDIVNYTVLNITPSPRSSFVDLNIYVTDTSKVYTYTVDSQSNATYQWYSSANGNILAGATTNTVDIKWNTSNSLENIYCMLSRGVCVDSISSVIVVSHIVGIDNGKSNEVLVYPNPAKDVLKFNSSIVLENASIKIYNTLGQLVFKNMLTQNELNVSGLPQGIYNFSLMIGGMNYRGKFIKE
jgi:hypothetical protein